MNETWDLKSPPLEPQLYGIGIYGDSYYGSIKWTNEPLSTTTWSEENLGSTTWTEQ